MAVAVAVSCGDRTGAQFSWLLIRGTYHPVSENPGALIKAGTIINQQ